MGGIALLMKRPEAALQIYNDVLRKVEERQDRYDRLEAATVHNRLGAAYRRKGDLQASVKHFELALQQPKLSSNTRAVTHLELGKTFDVMGQRERAVQQYNVVLSLPDFADSWGEARGLLEHPYRLSQTP
jgi:lipopolysaccharide biosynthesis regulator YciM